mgnify:FL=1
MRAGRGRNSPAFLWARREPPGRGEISIIPQPAHFVKRKPPQSCTKFYPEISVKLPVDFLKKICYNIFEDKERATKLNRVIGRALRLSIT